MSMVLLGERLEEPADARVCAVSHPFGMQVEAILHRDKPRANAAEVHAPRAPHDFFAQAHCIIMNRVHFLFQAFHSCEEPHDRAVLISEEAYAERVLDFLLGELSEGRTDGRITAEVLRQSRVDFGRDPLDRLGSHEVVVAGQNPLLGAARPLAPPVIYMPSPSEMRWHRCAVPMARYGSYTGRLTALGAGSDRLTTDAGRKESAPAPESERARCAAAGSRYWMSFPSEYLSGTFGSAPM